MENKSNIRVVITALVIVLLVALTISYFQAKKYNPNETLVVDETYELKDIVIKSNAAEVKIKQTDEQIIKVKIYGDKSKTKVDDYDKLSIESNIKELMFMSVNKAAQIEIELPKDYDNKIVIDTDYSTIDIEDFKDAKFNIDIDAGKVNLGETGNLKLDVDAADVNIKKINKQFDIEVDAGNVIIDEINIEENSSIEIDAGNLEIGKTNEVYFITKADVAEVNINRNYTDSNVHLNINMDIGNISIKN